jgi:hypothetical protein
MAMIRRRAQHALPAFVIGVLAASLTTAQKLDIEVEVDRAADFSVLTTYAWLKSPPVKSSIAPDAVTDRGLSQSVLEPHIVAAVDRELARRGLRQIVGGDPQTRVVYYAALDVGLDTAVLGSYYQYTTGWASPIPAGSAPVISSKVYERGSIVVDVVSVQTNKAIWRGTASTRVNHENTPQKRVARINDAIRRMFERFPKRPSRNK